MTTAGNRHHPRRQPEITRPSDGLRKAPSARRAAPARKTAPVRPAAPRRKTSAGGNRSAVRPTGLLQNEKFRNFLLAGSLLLLTAIILLGTGVVKLKSPDMAAIKTTLAGAVQPLSMTAGDEKSLKKNYGIEGRDLADFVYYAPKSSMDASEVMILKLNQASEADRYLSLIEARKSKQIESFKNYRPEEAIILENSILRVTGEYIIFISSPEADDINGTLKQAF